MKLHVIVLLLISVTNGALVNRLGKSACTQGPAFWCRDVKSAKVCGSVEYCAKKEWNQQVLGDSLPCSICKDGFKFVNELLEKNATKEEVETQLLEICTQLPSSFVTECKETISENFDLIYDEAVLILNNGGVFCTAIGLCHRRHQQDPQIKNNLDKLMDQAKDAYNKGQLPSAVVNLSPVIVKNSNDECSDCTSFFKDFVDVVQNQKDVVDYWQNLIVQECELLGPAVGQLCQQELKKEFIILLNQFASQDAATVCKGMNMCTSSGKKLPSLFTSQCSDCNNFFTDLKNDIAGPGKITAGITDMLKKSCDQAPVSLKSVCLSVIDQGMSGAWDLISKNPSENICETLFFCQENVVSAEKSKAVVSTNMKKSLVSNCTDCMNFMTDFKNVALNSQQVVNSLVEMARARCDLLDFLEKAACELEIGDVVRQALHQGQVMNVGDTCTSMEMCAQPPAGEDGFGGHLCNNCITFTQDWINAAKKEESFVKSLVEKQAKALCTEVPGILQKLCNEHLDEIIVQLIDSLKTTDAKSLCNQASLCTKEKEVVKPKVAIVELHSDSTQAKKLKLKGSIVCETCTQVTKAIANVLSEKSTQDEIKAALDGVCAEVPKQFQDTCKDLIDVYTPEIIGAITQGLEGGELCNAIGVCMQKKVTSTPKVIVKPKVAVKSDIECDLCVTVAKQLDDMISSTSTKAEIEQALDQVCELIPGNLRDTCQNLVATYTPQLIDMLMQELSPKIICSTLGLCPESAEKLKVKSAMSCRLCMTITTYLDSMVKPGDVKADVERALDMVCSVVPSQDKQICEEYVSAFAPELVDLLLQELSPKKLCSTLGMCATANQPKQTSKMVKVQDGPYCEVCMLIAQQLEQTLSQKSTKAEIEQALDQVCGLLPGKYENQCDQLIAQYTPMIIDLLVQEFNPKQLCSLMQLCSASKASKMVKVQDGPYCEVCMLIAQQLEQTLSQKSTKAEIEQALDQVCGLLPGQYENQCDQLIAQYTPMIIDLLVQEFNPKQLCSLMQLCSASKTTNATMKSEIACEMCHVVVSRVDSFLESNATKEEIRSALTHTCNLLPHTITGECRLFVDLNFNMIIGLLEKEVSPDHVCIEIGVCNGKKSAKVPVVQKPAPQPAATQKSAPTKLKFKPYQDGTGCDVCKLVIEAAEQQISSNSTKEEIENELKKACTALPSETQQFCKDVINEYIPEIITAIVDKGDPLTVCSEVGLCKDHKKLVGANPCTFGPSFWCANRKNALQCNALTHCEKHFW